MASNYDNSAWFYDFLSRIVYGKALMRSQIYLLPHIPPGASVLIAGGGTGWIMEEIVKVHPTGLKITYVEISAKMMAISMKRDTAGNEVAYLNQPVEDVRFSELFDVIITPFLFDNFTEPTLHKVFQHVHHNLKPTGIWLNTDFILAGKWWQHVLLNSMILFFRIICGIEATRLPNIQKQFESYGYTVIDERLFFNGFILSVVYQQTALKHPLTNPRN